MSGGIAIAMTGASGAAYGLRLMQRLGGEGLRMHVLLSDAARIVLRHEAQVELGARPDAWGPQLAAHLRLDAGLLRPYALDDWFAPVASGSSGIRRMVIIPCSMGTLGRIAHGLSGNLIERAADVQLKEQGRLILVPRETPLSVVHLENMLKLARMGAQILPAMPGWYHAPRTLDALIDFVVDRVLDQLHVPNPGAIRWGE